MVAGDERDAQRPGDEQRAQPHRPRGRGVDDAGAGRLHRVEQIDDRRHAEPPATVAVGGNRQAAHGGQVAVPRGVLTGPPAAQHPQRRPRLRGRVLGEPPHRAGDPVQLLEGVGDHHRRHRPLPGRRRAEELRLDALCEAHLTARVVRREQVREREGAGAGERLHAPAERAEAHAARIERPPHQLLVQPARGEAQARVPPLAVAGGAADAPVAPHQPAVRPDAPEHVVGDGRRRAPGGVRDRWRQAVLQQIAHQAAQRRRDRRRSALQIALGRERADRVGQGPRAPVGPARRDRARAQVVQQRPRAPGRRRDGPGGGDVERAVVVAAARERGRPVAARRHAVLVGEAGEQLATHRAGDPDRDLVGGGRPRAVAPLPEGEEQQALLDVLGRQVAADAVQGVGEREGQARLVHAGRAARRGSGAGGPCRPRSPRRPPRRGRGSARRPPGTRW